MLKPFLFVAAIAFTLEAAPVIAGGPHLPIQDAPAKSTAAQSAAALEKAKKLYAVDCAVCHGDNGERENRPGEVYGRDACRLDRSQVAFR